MTDVTYTREELGNKTVKELKNMCVYELEIPGFTKKRKDDVIDAIMAKCGAETSGEAAEITAEESGGIEGIEFKASSTLERPEADFGFKTSTVIHVSCGASSGKFPVVGKSVAEVGEFLREVLNVDKLSTGLVNGQEVAGDYILDSGDHLEYLKPAGKKGC